MLRRQIAKATRPDGQIEVPALLEAVNETYLEHVRDLRRMTRANALMAEELLEMLQLVQAASETDVPDQGARRLAQLG